MHIRHVLNELVLMFKQLITFTEKESTYILFLFMTHCLYKNNERASLLDK